MKVSLVILFTLTAIVTGQTPEQFRAARDIFRVVAATIDDYLQHPSGSPLDEKLQLAFQVLLLSANSNITAATACYALYQTTSYVCGIAAGGVPASAASNDTTTSTGSTGSSGSTATNGSFQFPV